MGGWSSSDTMEIVKEQSSGDKKAMTTPGIKVISPEFAGKDKNSGLAASDGAEERRRLDIVQDEEKIEDCRTLKGEPSKIADSTVSLPQMTIRIPSPEFADEKKKSSIVVDREGVEERTSERRPGEEENDECTTPKGEAYRIPAPIVCPPPPARRFKRLRRQMTEIPPEYFPVPEDLTSVFISLKKFRTS